MALKQEYHSVPIVNSMFPLSTRPLSSFVVAYIILLALLHYFLNLYWVFPRAWQLRHAWFSLRVLLLVNKLMQLGLFLPGGLCVCPEWLVLFKGGPDSTLFLVKSSTSRRCDSNQSPVTISWAYLVFLWTSSPVEFLCYFANSCKWKLAVELK